MKAHTLNQSRAFISADYGGVNIDAKPINLQTFLYLWNWSSHNETDVDIKNKKHDRTTQHTH